MPDIKARIESTLEKLKVNETTFMGVFDETNVACYAALLQKIRTEVGTDKTQINMFAVTAIKDRSLFVYRIAVYQNAATVQTVLANLKANVATLMAANK